MPYEYRVLCELQVDLDSVEPFCQGPLTVYQFFGHQLSRHWTQEWCQPLAQLE